MLLGDSFQFKDFKISFAGLPTSGESTVTRMFEKELSRVGIPMEALSADEVRKEKVRSYNADRDQNKDFVKNSITGPRIYLVLHIINRKVCNPKKF